MEFALFVYAAMLVGNILTTAKVVFMLSMVAFLCFGLLVYLDGVSFAYQKKYFSGIAWASLLAGVVLVFTPSEKTVWLMGGAYITQTVIQSDIGKDFEALIYHKVKEIVKAETENAK